MTCFSFITTTIFDSPADLMPQEPARKRFFADAFTGEALRQLLPPT